MPIEHFLDVRELFAPEPFEMILKEIKKLKTGEYIYVLHHRKPYPLLQVLSESNHEYLLLEGKKNDIEIIIWKKADIEVGSYCTSRFGCS